MPAAEANGQGARNNVAPQMEEATVRGVRDLMAASSAACAHVREADYPLLLATQPSRCLRAREGGGPLDPAGGTKGG